MKRNPEARPEDLLLAKYTQLKEFYHDPALEAGYYRYTHAEYPSKEYFHTAREAAEAGFRAAYPNLNLEGTRFFTTFVYVIYPCGNKYEWCMTRSGYIYFAQKRLYRWHVREQAKYAAELEAKS